MHEVPRFTWADGDADSPNLGRITDIRQPCAAGALELP